MARKVANESSSSRVVATAIESIDTLSAVNRLAVDRNRYEFLIKTKAQEIVNQIRKFNG